MRQVRRRHHSLCPWFRSVSSSALVEDLVMGDTPSMTTVCHLDGADLRMTHFCAAQNQPRLKAAEVDEAAATARFSLVDVTNATAHPAYVDEFFIHVVDDNDVTLQFDFRGATGKKAVETVTLKRVNEPTNSSGL